MKKVACYVLTLALLGIGCTGNKNENSDTVNTIDKTDDDDFDGRPSLDTAVRDSVDSMLLPAAPPATPGP